jgi:hypothetical protein
MRPRGKETPAFPAAALVLMLAGASCRRAAEEASPKGWVCPMHAEVIEATDVPCRICGMRLEPRHAAGAYICLQHGGTGAPGSTGIAPGPCEECAGDRAAAPAVLVHECPEHPGVSLREPGSCPLCGKALVPRTAAAAWSCPRHPRPLRLSSGICAACGEPLAEILIELPHGDHSPKHGGIFFMAEDRWHHLEGTLPEPGLFRLHVYDDFTRPLPPGGVEARLERWRTGPDGERARDPRPIPLGPSPAGDVLEARIEGFSLPIELTLEARFPARGGGPPLERPQRFDFAFSKLSGGEDGPAQGPAPRGARLEIPSDPRRIAEDLAARARAVGEIVARRGLSEVYVPALEAKDLALALRERAAHPEDEGALERAARKVVRGAWLLDLHGDQGNLEGVERANALFQEGATALIRLAGPASGDGAPPR